MSGSGAMIGVVDLMPGAAVVVYEDRAILRLGGVAVYTVALEAFPEGVSAQLTRVLAAGLVEAFGADAAHLVTLSKEPTSAPFPRIVLETVDGFPLWDYTAAGVPTADQLRESYRLTRAMSTGLEAGL